MPVPAWLLKLGGRPEAFCHREMLDAVRYLVDNGVKWMALPVDQSQHGRHRTLLDQQRAVRCLPLPRRDHAPHTKKPLLIEQGLPLPQRTH
ncbi:hypothetical protein ACIHCQ_44300 [Streptomyces sp. NPDC052236]|uniref:hypothetical protein n=1 Tax=Streptomyces sp. NPDC052236 TaxID=3365686 RepID=UPI0037D4CBF6